MLITGANGLLGKEMFDIFHEEYDVRPTDERECDVTLPVDCRRVFGGVRPDFVLHCAAYTAVDRAEAEAERAMAVNRDGTRNVARECREHGALLITFGTDYIFDGSSSLPYEEDAPARPLSAYGRSKWEAEEALRAETKDHLLIRSQWLYGPHGRNFVFAILERARRGEPLRVVSDQRGCPTYTRDLAAATKRLLSARARGTYHFSNAGEASWHEFAAFLLEHTGSEAVPLTPVSSGEMAYPAPRPAYSVLSKEKYRRVTGEVPRRWEEAVLEFLKTPCGRRVAG